MKTKIYLLSFLTLTLLISSCGSLSISQKRYSRGLNIDLFASKDAKTMEQKAKVATKKSANNNQVNIAENISNNTPKLNNTVVDFSIKSDKIEAKPIKLNKSLIKNVRQLRNTTQQISKVSNQTFNNSEKKSAYSASPKENTETETILLVILALFPILCLIAVYLYDGGITTNFWIDLLLHLTFIGAIIFALLVVLDVIDLS
ncbi:MAG: hypothetical protein PSX81_15145 [bacterium]|nr:hypothetical protein [bacterium]